MFLYMVYLSDILLSFFFQAPKQQPAFSTTPPRSVATPYPVVSLNLPEKPAEEDRIEPAKSTYCPVSLPAPKKLKNPFAALEKQLQQTLSPSSSSSLGGAKELTWSERWALTKKQAEEEEARSHCASFVPPAAGLISNFVFKSNAPSFGKATVAQSGPRNFGAVGTAIGTMAAFSAQSIPSVPVSTPSSHTSAQDTGKEILSAIQKLEHTLSEAINKLKHILSEAINKLKHILSEAINKLEHTLSEAINKLEHTLSEAINKLKLRRKEEEFIILILN